MTGSVDVHATEVAPEPPLDPDRVCETCSWPVAAFDHAARHRWTEYWLSLAPANRVEQRKAIAP